MFLAAGGVPPLRLVLLTMVGGCLAAASANAFNCVLDRDIDERMRRTRRRPLPRHAVDPLSASIFGDDPRDRCHGLAGLHGQLAVGGAGPGRQRLLHRRLHIAAEAAYASEHRLGRHRRLLPAADRLDRGHRLLVGGPAGAVRDRLLLDAAAHLGAGHPLPGGLRRGPGADAAGGPLRAGGGPADHGLRGAHRGLLAAALAGGRHRLALPGRGPGRRGCAALGVRGSSGCGPPRA